MDDVEPTIWDSDGDPETVYVKRVPAQTTDDGWLVTSLDVGTWRPLHVGDRLVALDYDSPDEFLVEVTAVEITRWEVYYRLRRLADLDPAIDFHHGRDGR